MHHRSVIKRNKIKLKWRIHTSSRDKIIHKNKTKIAILHADTEGGNVTENKKGTF